MRATVDWLLRTVVLALSALATLALIGSLASVSNTPLGEAFPGRVAPPPIDAADAPGDQAERAAARPGVEQPAAPAAGQQAAPAARRVADGGEAEVARWLKALTYAVLALAGFVAAAMIALMRIAHHLGRIAAR